MSSLDDRIGAIRAIKNNGPVSVQYSRHKFSVLSPFLELIPDAHIGAFVDMLNIEWGSFFVVTPETFMDRLASGEVFIAAYDESGPVGLVETQCLQVKGLPLRRTKEPYVQQIIDGSTPEELAHVAAKAVKEQYAHSKGYYWSITEGGIWKPTVDANLAMWIDITRDRESESNVATGMVEFGKDIMVDNRFALPQFQGVEYVLTFTPRGKGIQNWHFRNFAIDTGVEFVNARPGYARDSTVHPMCYLTSNYQPPRGKRPV